MEPHRARAVAAAVGRGALPESAAVGSTGVGQPAGRQRPTRAGWQARAESAVAGRACRCPHAGADGVTGAGAIDLRPRCTHSRARAAVRAVQTHRASHPGPAAGRQVPVAVAGPQPSGPHRHGAFRRSGAAAPRPGRHGGPRPELPRLQHRGRTGEPSGARRGREAPGLRRLRGARSGGQHGRSLRDVVAQHASALGPVGLVDRHRPCGATGVGARARWSVVPRRARAEHSRIRPGSGLARNGHRRLWPARAGRAGGDVRAGAAEAGGRFRAMAGRMGRPRSAIGVPGSDPCRSARGGRGTGRRDRRRCEERPGSGERP